MFKLSELRAEHVDTVRERVLSLIKGKKLVGYHLPQKIADLGLIGELDENPKTSTPDKSDQDSSVPNALKETEKAQYGIQAPKTDTKKAVL